MGIGSIFGSNKPKGRREIKVNPNQAQAKEDSDVKIINVKPATDLLCQNRNVELSIKSWMEGMGWLYEDFSEILKQAGLEMPVQISSPSPNYLICYDSKNKGEYEFNIELGLPQSIAIRKTNLKKEELEVSISYLVSINNRRGDPSAKPEITQKAVVYKWRNRSMEKGPCDHYRLKIFRENTPKRLEVKILSWKEGQAKLKEKQSEINGYLLYTAEPNQVVTLYKDICKILGVATDMSVTLYEETDNGEAVLKNYQTSSGKMEEYAAREGETTYYFYSNGSWECRDSEGQKLVCVPQKGYGIELCGSDDDIISGISEIATQISKANDTAQKLWNNFLAEHKK